MRQWPPDLGRSGVFWGPLPSGTGQSPGPISIPSWAGSGHRQGLPLPSGSRDYNHPSQDPSQEAQLSRWQWGHRLHEECFPLPNCLPGPARRGPCRCSQGSQRKVGNRWGLLVFSVLGGGLARLHQSPLPALAVGPRIHSSPHVPFAMPSPATNRGGGKEGVRVGAPPPSTVTPPGPPEADARLCSGGSP